MNNICTSETSRENENKSSMIITLVVCGTRSLFTSRTHDHSVLFGQRMFPNNWAYSHTSLSGVSLALLFSPAPGAHYAPEQINSKHLFVTCPCCMRLPAVPLNEISLIRHYGGRQRRGAPSIAVPLRLVHESNLECAGASSR